MKLLIDTTAQTLVDQSGDQQRVVPLYSPEAFGLLSQAWLKVGWELKYSYTFSWMGRPIIQLPEDMIRIQEVIYRVKPDVIVETGVAHGGSLIYYASLCEALHNGRVIGVDIEIRPHNRAAIERHELFPRITLIEGSSTAPEVVAQVRSMIEPSQTVLVMLDSNHTRQHVLDELDAYHTLVTPGSYVIAADGIMRDLHDVPRGRSDWDTNNPAEAVLEFARLHPEFVLEQPAWPFNESELRDNITYWPAAWLRRKHNHE